MKDTGKLTKLGKLIVKASTDKNMTKTQLAEAVGMSPQHSSYILYGTRSGERYILAIIVVLGLDPCRVEKTIAA